MNAFHRPRRVWVTRTRPQAEATAARLTALGFEPVVAPLLEAQAIADSLVDLTGVDALAFTSGHAVTIFAALSSERALRVFTVGETTAAVARRAGFSSVASAGGDAGALAELIANTRPRPLGVLNPTARQTAADLPALLAERGVAVTAIAVYETLEVDPPAPPSDIDAVLVHSPKAARALAGILARHPQTARIDAYAISAAAAAPLRSSGLRSMSVAPHPDEAALLDLLEASVLDPAAAPPRPRGLGAGFWAMIAFGVFCAIAGGIVGLYGPRLFPKHPAPASSAPTLGHALGKPPPPR